MRSPSDEKKRQFEYLKGETIDVVPLSSRGVTGRNKTARAPLPETSFWEARKGGKAQLKSNFRKNFGKKKSTHVYQKPDTERMKAGRN